MHPSCYTVVMGTTKAITLQLDLSDYERLVSEARRLGLSPSVLAQAYVRASLTDSLEAEAVRRRMAGLAALQGLASLRERLPDAGPVDVVQLIREGRTELERRSAR